MNSSASVTTPDSSSFINSPTSFLNSTMHDTTANNTSDEVSLVEQYAKFVTPVWLFLGVPGNILAGLVWAQRQMRPSSGIFLAVLALDELIFLIFLVILEVHSKWERPLLNIPVLCQSYPVVMLMTQQLSPLLVLSFTLQRYVAICHPFLKEKLCTMRKSYLIIGVLTAFCFCINIIESYFWTMNKTDECDLRDSVTEGGLFSVWTVWHSTTELTIFGAVPFAILILNILVIRERRKLSKAEKALNLKYQPQSNMNKTVVGNPSKSQNHKMPPSGGGGNRSSATTLTLLAVSTYLIVTVLPVTICYILMPVFSWDHGPPPPHDVENYKKWQRFRVYKDVRLVVEEIGKSHYALNFFIYMMTGKMFRKQLRLLLGKLLRRGVNEKSHPFRRDGSPPPVSNSKKAPLLHESDHPPVN